ncbi:MAG: TetR/AcrR family transcriptional regulator [Thioalkalispiraceae bacterium]|jgi:AcrR family transcriptional regulator
MARRSDHSREEIQAMAIEAAIHILNTEGPGSLSTRKVAKSIGYTAGTLYLVFKNLDELILQVNAATLDELESAIEVVAEDQPDPVTTLKAMGLAYLHYAQDHFARWSLLFTHQLPGDEPVPEWFDSKVAAVFEKVKQPLHEINSDCDEQSCLQAAREIWSGVHGACDLGLKGKLSLGGEFKADNLVESLIENYLVGFAKV